MFSTGRMVNDEVARHGWLLGLKLTSPGEGSQGLIVQAEPFERWTHDRVVLVTGVHVLEEVPKTLEHLGMYVGVASFQQRITHAACSSSIGAHADPRYGTQRRYADASA